MELTPGERAAARQWREQGRAELARLNATDPPTLVLLPFANHVRHECAAFAGQSVSFHFREMYLVSPDGRWGFIYREGRCPDCGLSGRSAESRLVDARERPPIGRTASGTRAGGPPAAHTGQGG